MRSISRKADLFLCIAAIILASLTIFCDTPPSDDSTANQPPVADAGGDYTGTVLIEIQLEGAESYDPEGDPITYAWEFVSTPDGNTANLENASTETPSFTPNVIGEYVIRLQVTDSEGNLSEWAFADITVVENQPPVADPGGPFTGTVNVEIILDGSTSSDPEDDPIEYAWEVVTVPDGSGITVLTNAATATPSFTPDVVGDYVVRLQVTDTYGNDSQWVSTTITVNPVATNQPPVADPGGPYTGLVGDVIIFDGSESSDPEDDPLIYNWDFGDGTSADNATPTPSHAYSSLGVYTVTLEVDDGFNTPVSAIVTAAVFRQLPDTGQTTYYDASSEITDQEDIDEFPGQDAAYDESISFESIDNATDETIIVHDLIADLYWHADESSSSMTYAQAESYCEDSTLGDYTDWRIPSRAELITIVNYGSVGAEEAATFAPFQETTIADLYWTTSPDISFSGKFFGVNFTGPNEYGTSSGRTQDSTANVRCVRGAPLPVVHDFVDNNDGTITDQTTGYMWTQTPAVTTGDDPISNWQTALQYCDGLVLGGDDPGYDDWRLPNIKQLETLTAFDNAQDPVVDSIFDLSSLDFLYDFWSSTTYDADNTTAWYIDFNYGDIRTGWNPQKLGYGYECNVFCIRKLY